MSRAWAIDVQLAGVDYRFATEAMVLGGETYESGLGDLELSRAIGLADRVAVELVTLTPWAARFAAAGWLIEGGSATVSLVRDGVAVPWLRGQVRSVRWGAQGEPLTFDLSLLDPDRYRIPDPRAVIDPYTQPDRDPSIAVPDPNDFVLFGDYSNFNGKFYPIIIGYPGDDDAAGVVQPVVPCPIAQTVTQIVLDDEGHPSDIPDWNVAVLADRPIEAAQVWILDSGVELDSDQVSESANVAIAVDVAVARDKLGRRYAYTLERLGVLWSGQPAVYAGFSKAAGFGGGLRHHGRLVRGAADIFEWLVSSYTDLELDLGRMRANALALNAYAFDTFINDEISPFEWFEAAILPFIPAMICTTGKGLYLAYTGTQSPAAAVAEIEVGRNAERRGAVSVGSAPIVNELTYRWGRNRDQSGYFNTAVLTAEYKRPIAVPGGAFYEDARALRSQIAAESQRVYGVRPSTLELPTVWDSATAHRAARDAITAAAFPPHTITYETELGLDLFPGDLVRVTDDDLAFTRLTCTVLDVVVGISTVIVQVRPLRNTPTAVL